MTTTVLMIVPSLAKAAPVQVAIDLVRELRREGQPTRVIALRRSHATDWHGQSDIASSQGLAGLMRICIPLLRAGGKLIVHSHGLRPDLAALCLKSLFPTRIQWVSTQHNDVEMDLPMTHSWKGKLAAPVWIRAVRGADRIVYLNEYLLSKYRRRFVDAQLAWIRNGRCSQWLDVPGRKALRVPGQIHVGFLGVLSVRKQILPLAEVLRRIPTAHLTVAGEGPLLPDLMRLYQDCDRLSYLGRIDDLDDFFQRIDVLVLPSKTEGFPLVIPESLAHGVPCVLSRLEQYRSLAGKKGIFFIDELCETELTGIFRQLSEDYDGHSRSARVVWQQELTVEAMACLYRRLYAEMAT